MHFLFEPADRAGAKLDPLREAKIRLHLVNHRATETREATDLRQTQNPKRLATADRAHLHDSRHKMILRDAVGCAIWSI